MRGRKATPTALKQLAGNPGKRPLNTSEPPVPIPARTPRVPDFLNRYGKREWRRLVKILVEVGLYSVVDRAALAMYCQAYGRWIEAEIAVEVLRQQHEDTIDGGWVLVSDKGNPYQNPMLSIANTAWEQVRKMLPEFGLTPSSRQRLIFEPTDEPNQLEMLFFRRRVQVVDDET